MGGLEISLEGRTALVTGASSGIGAEIAATLARCGARVVGTGRDPERLEVVMAGIRDEGGEAEAVVADLAEDGAVEHVIATTIERFGALTTLVHSAGLFLVQPLADGLPALDRQWNVNVRGTYRLTQAAMPHLGPGGSVLVISSITAWKGFPGGSSYAMTKAAQLGFVKNVAVEAAAQGVRVNALAPGLIRTPIHDTFLADPATEAGIVATTPLRRIGQPQDIGPMAAFLCSDLASYVTGATFVVDGGIDART
jgi:NAD(P)-dependent dehydrogenase (short-subunit alcohol dehydrogenase family)